MISRPDSAPLKQKVLDAISEYENTELPQEGSSARFFERTLGYKAEGRARAKRYREKIEAISGSEFSPEDRQILRQLFDDIYPTQELVTNLGNSTLLRRQLREVLWEHLGTELLKLEADSIHTTLLSGMAAPMTGYAASTALIHHARKLAERTAVENALIKAGVIQNGDQVELVQKQVLGVR